MSKWREKPAELAVAQIIETHEIIHISFRENEVSKSTTQAGDLNWGFFGGSYRPVRDPDGRPYVSAEGLKPWAQYVAVDSVEDHTGNTVFQYSCKPEEYQENGKWGVSSKPGAKYMEAPSTHAIPGDPADSLARVWREE